MTYFCGHPNLHCPPHLASPTLPIAWHPRIRIFCNDLNTIAALLGVEISVLIFENETGELSASAMVYECGVVDEARRILRGMCNRVMDAMAYVCMVCGALGSCYQIRSGMLLVCCGEHGESDKILIRRGKMRPVRSLWRLHQKKMSVLMLIATKDRAATATLSFYSRYNEPFLGQILAEADALRARIAIDIAIETSSGSAINTKNRSRQCARLLTTQGTAFPACLTKNSRSRWMTSLKR